MEYYIRTMDLDYLSIHSLAHKFSHASVFSRGKKAAFALRALGLMEKYGALHPKYLDFICLIQQLELPQASQFDNSWVEKLKECQDEPEFLEDEHLAAANKEDALDYFVPRFQKLFIRCDFQLLNYHANRIMRYVLFAAASTDHELFVRNRRFEMLFYQIATTLYGELWFSSLNSLAERSPIREAPWSRAHTEKKCDQYYSRSQYLFKSLDEKTPEVIESVKREFKFYHLLKWACAMAKFKENRLLEYVADFDALFGHISVLDEIGCLQEALCMYGAASICSRPFKELSFKEREDLVDLYTRLDTPSCRLYSLLSVLSEADFVEAKKISASRSLAPYLDAHFSYVFPRKSVGSFWKFLSVIIDFKGFLLIMSLTKKIPRDKLLRKLGYSPDSPQQDIFDVSNRLLMLISLLGLGEINLAYDDDGDYFYHFPVSDGEKVQRLTETVDELDHLIRAEASAQLVRSMLVQKYFTHD